MKTFLAVFLIVLLPIAAAAEVKYVQVDKARLLKKASAFSPALAILSYRTPVDIVGKQGAYYCVQVKQGKGFMAQSSLSVQKPKFSSKLSGTYVSSDEVATATKGFNAQVESEYRQKNPELQYAVIDQIETQTHYANPQTDFSAFRKQGALGEFKKGGE